jgi:hypothetical protein
MPEPQYWDRVVRIERILPPIPIGVVIQMHPAPAKVGLLASLVIQMNLTPANRKTNPAVPDCCFFRFPHESPSKLGFLLRNEKTRTFLCGFSE